jgi:hypothetical protein
MCRLPTGESLIVTNPAAPHDGAWPSSGNSADDGWGPSTAVYGGGSKHIGRAFNAPATKPRDDEWTPAGPASRDQQRANRRAEQAADRDEARAEAAADRASERGVSWWLALIVLIVIAAIGGVIDTLGSIQVRGGFNIGIIVASVVAILIVKRSHMFPVVIAPPIVYSGGAIFQLYLRSSGLHDKRVVFDAAANYLVYGFPAIAAATAAVLIIAGLRMITRK